MEHCLRLKVTNTIRSLNICNRYLKMRSVTAILPLLAFAASILAAPTPLQPVGRAVPNVREVIRNPAPVDDNLRVEVDILGNKLEIGLRGVPALEKEIAPPNEVTG